MDDVAPTLPTLLEPPRRDRRIVVTAAVSAALHLLILGWLLLPRTQTLTPTEPAAINVDLVPPSAVSLGRAVVVGSGRRRSQCRRPKPRHLHHRRRPRRHRPRRLRRPNTILGRGRIVGRLASSAAGVVASRRFCLVGADSAVATVAHPSRAKRGVIGANLLGRGCVRIGQRRVRGI